MMDVGMYVWMDGQTDERMDGLTQGWMNVWMDG